MKVNVKLTANIQPINQLPSSVDISSSEAKVIVPQILLNNLLESALVRVIGELKSLISLIVSYLCHVSHIDNIIVT